MHRNIEILEDINNIIINTKNNTYIITPDGLKGELEILSDYDLEPNEYYLMITQKKNINITTGFKKIMKIDNKE